MIEQDGFTDYFQSIIIQTKFLSSKCLIKTYSKYSDDIVSMGVNNSSIIDDFFFYNKLGEHQLPHDRLHKFDSNLQSYQVKCSMIRIDWIIKTKGGKQFLFNLLNSENNAVYENEMIQYLITYLYKEFRVSIIYQKLPFFILQILTLVVAVFMNPALNSDGYVYYRTETQNKLSVIFNLIMSVGTLMFAIP